MNQGCVHFVGFRGEEYWSAIKIWGKPAMIHRGWDRRAQRDVGPEDLVIFAVGTEEDDFPQWNYDDIDEKWL